MPLNLCWKMNKLFGGVVLQTRRVTSSAYFNFNFSNQQTYTHQNKIERWVKLVCHMDFDKLSSEFFLKTSIVN